MTSDRAGLRTAIDLTNLGARLREQRFRRENPDADAAKVRQFMAAWWHDRSGAPCGDADDRSHATGDRG